MKIFAIRNETGSSNRDLAYLFYYPSDKRFYIELPEDADEWETPLLLSSFVKKGERTVNSYWSKIWVRQRIVPADRQNIGQILRDNRLLEYDEYGLLMLSMGRCAQDDYYLVPLKKSEIAQDILKRFERRIEEVIPMEDHKLLVFFQNGVTKLCDVKMYLEEHSKYRILLQREDYFQQVQVQTGGYGIEWDETLYLMDDYLYQTGRKVPLSMKDFIFFTKQQVLNTGEAAEYMGCSRQYINELTKKEELHPIKATEKNTLYLKSELRKRKNGI